MLVGDWFVDRFGLSDDKNILSNSFSSQLLDKTDVQTNVTLIFVRIM